jgi:hypothetical protein
MRQKSWNAVKTGGSRRTRKQRALLRNLHLDCHSRDQDLFELPKTKVLSPISTNRRGFFNWSNWDGSLWPTTALRAHQMSQWFYEMDRVGRMFRRGQIRSTRGAHAEREEFWREYYRATARAIKSLQSLNLLVTEASAIRFILRTAPARFTKCMGGRIQAFNLTTLELQRDCKDLYQMRRIIVHRKQNPEYFKAEVERFRCMADARQKRTLNTLADKSLRLQLKTSFGPEWARFAKIRYSYGDRSRNATNYASEFGATLNTYPPRWTIEPLKASARVMMSQLRTSTLLMEDYIYVNRPRVLTAFLFRIQRLLDTISADSWELQELLDEMAALRYYRLHRFADSSLGKEVELGKRLWQRLLHEALFVRTVPEAVEEAAAEDAIGAVGEGVFLTTSAPIEQQADLNVNISSSCNEARTINDGKAQVRRSTHTRTVPPTSIPTGEATSIDPLAIPKSRIIRTNSRGFFAWKNWKGEDWHTEALQQYLRDDSIQAAADAQANYNTIKLRVSRTVPREVDSFLMAHYKSQWMANQRMHAFTRLQCNLAVLEFLLRTAPPKISRAVATPITEMNILNYTTGTELEKLRRLKTTIACLPHNPLFFKSLVIGYKTSSEVSLLYTSTRTDMKSDRSRYKAANGFIFDQRKYQQSRVNLNDKLRDIARLRSNSWSWKDEYPFNVVEPFADTITLTAVRQLRLLAALRQLRYFCKTIIPSMSWVWLNAVKVLNGAEQIAIQLRHLGRDLTAIRYYKMHRFPNSISKKILELDRAGYQQISSTLHWKLDEEETARMNEVKEKKAQHERIKKIIQEKKSRKNEREQKKKEKQSTTQTATPTTKQTGRMPRSKKIRLNKRIAREALASQSGE